MRGLKEERMELIPADWKKDFSLIYKESRFSVFGDPKTRSYYFNLDGAESVLGGDGELHELLGIVKTAITADQAIRDSQELSRCQACNRLYVDEGMVPLKKLKNLLERITPGEQVPSGECPDCGAFCHIVDSPFLQEGE
jgi:hypothetical protein